MQEDFEPILERQIHHLINYAQGIMHIGQRDYCLVACEQGRRRERVPAIPPGKDPSMPNSTRTSARFLIRSSQSLHRKDKVEEMLAKAKEVYGKRDVRIEG